LMGGGGGGFSPRGVDGGGEHKGRPWRKAAPRELTEGVKKRHRFASMKGKLDGKRPKGGFQEGNGDWTDTRQVANNQVKGKNNETLSGKKKEEWRCGGGKGGHGGKQKPVVKN